MPTVGAGELWNEIAARLREVPPEERWTHPDLGRLHELIREIAAQCLVQRFKLERSQSEELATDLLLSKLGPLIEAQVPYPYLLTSLKNAARSWLRSPKNTVGEPPKSDQGADGQAKAEAVAELSRVWEQLTPKEREIFSAIAAGEEREQLAARFNMTRATLDQQISRARKRLREAGFG